MIVPPATTDEDSQKTSIVRTFLVGPKQDRAKLLQREVLVTTALVENVGPIGRLKVFDSAGVVDSKQMGEKLGIDIEDIDLRSKLQPEADCADPIDFAIAYGATLALSEKGRSVDFREDFSPFQGKKLRLQKTLKAAAISVTILLIAVGLYFQTQLFSVSRGNNNLRGRFAKDYTEVTLKKLPASFKIKDAVRELGKLKRQIEDEKKGLITEEKSISSNLTQVLAAFVKCAAQTNLNIDTITVTTNDILITGDTSSRQNTLKMYAEVRKGLDILRESYSLKDGRDNFRITVAPKT